MKKDCEVRTLSCTFHEIEPTTTILHRFPEHKKIKMGNQLTVRSGRPSTSPMSTSLELKDHSVAVVDCLPRYIA